MFAHIITVFVKNYLTNKAFSALLLNLLKYLKPTFFFLARLVTQIYFIQALEKCVCLWVFENGERERDSVNIIKVFMSSFYAQRFQKRQKESQVKQLFALLGSARVKAACKHVDEIDP